MNIAIMCHNKKQDLMVQFCTAYCGILSKHNVCATNATGKMIADATGLNVNLFLSHELGGIEQIGQRISYNEIDMVLCFETNNPGEYILNMSRIIRRSAVSSWDLTAAEIEGRRQAHEIVAFMKKHIPGFENCRLISTGPVIGVRESRKIDGAYKLTADDLLTNRMFPDAIAMGGYPIDIHSPDGGKTNHRHLKKGSWYSIPYGCLHAPQAENLLVAGRCISATHEACAAVRVTPVLMGISEAAGIAAAMAAQADGIAANVDTEALRAAIRQAGGFLEEYQA